MKISTDTIPETVWYNFTDEIIYNPKKYTGDHYYEDMIAHFGATGGGFDNEENESDEYFIISEENWLIFIMKFSGVKYET